MVRQSSESTESICLSNILEIYEALWKTCVEPMENLHTKIWTAKESLHTVSLCQLSVCSLLQDRALGLNGVV